MANEGLQGKNDISHEEYSVESKAPVFLTVPKTDLFLVLDLQCGVTHSLYIQRLEGETILISFIHRQITKTR